ncbi:hypothetical protein P3339_19770 [Microbulbifer sp. MLAF003]|uniref:hypothetical protein n=1 Tax=Microbulbifer sp. MLAF003 TaxID=3032582 RepID=UPI0024AD1BE3|nr:hypothetical protein [Microbulbifer sp. MLAF003]WHI50645.1 hypothetical protein P3339_19770 [Microbulbifer sp. MLAF003]
MQHRDNAKEDIAPIEPANFTFGGEEAHSPKATNTNKGKPKKERFYGPIVIGAAMLSGLIGVFWGLPQVVEKPPLRSLQISSPQLITSRKMLPKHLLIQMPKLCNNAGKSRKFCRIFSPSRKN